MKSPRIRNAAARVFVTLLSVLFLLMILACGGGGNTSSTSSSSPAINPSGESSGSSWTILLNESQLDPEEAGCYLLLSDAYAKSATHAEQYFIADKDYETYDQLGDAAKRDLAASRRKESHRQLKSLFENWYGSLKKVLPPESMIGLHVNLKSLLASSNADAADAEFDIKCLVYYKSFAEFRKKIENRTPSKTKLPGWAVYFEPRYTPFKGNLATGEVSFELSFNTPIGKFSASPVLIEGFNKLIIVFGENERHLKLDKPFMVHLPDGFELRKIENNPKEKFLRLDIAQR